MWRRYDIKPTTYLRYTGTFGRARHPHTGATDVDIIGYVGTALLQIDSHYGC
jgi:hypothetical protein